jgi:hypothetical protein
MSRHIRNALPQPGEREREKETRGETGWSWPTDIFTTSQVRLELPRYNLLYLFLLLLLEETHNVRVRAKFHLVQDILVPMDVSLDLVYLLHLRLVVTAVNHAHACRLGAFHAGRHCCPLILIVLSVIGDEKKDCGQLPGLSSSESDHTEY